MRKINLYGLMVVLGMASVASCTSNEPDATTEPGEPTTLSITLGEGTDAKSRASGAPVIIDEQKIKKGIVLVYKPSSGGQKVLDGYATFDFTSTTGPYTQSVHITKGIREVYVVANVPNAIINELKVKPNPPGVFYLINRLSLKDFYNPFALPMSGYKLNVDCTAGTPTSPTTATVQMHFVGSRVHIDWDLAALPAEIAASGLAIESVYLLNVKASSDVFNPTSMSSLTANEPNYLCGLADPTPFASGAMYPASSSTNTFSGTDPQLYMNDIVADKGFDNNYFYIFENASSNTYTPDRPLIVVLQAKTTDGTKYYYPIVLNSTENGSGTSNGTNPGDGSYGIVRGQIYNVKAIIKNFGNDNPYNEIKKGALTVTVNPATWVAVPQIDQEYN